MNYTLEDIKKQSPYPIGELNTAYAKYFVGNSYLYPINDQEVLISNVTFEPGCRNNWHIHHGAGQILLCTAGRGYYQEWGKPAQELNVGDTVYIAPEIKHWHGAAPESYFVHIAESVPNKNASNEWLEAVDEEEYLKLKQNKTIRKGYLIVVYFKSYFEGSLGNFRNHSWQKEALIIIGSCFLFTGTIMLFIYEHIVNSLFFSRKYVIMRHDKDFL